MSPAQQRGLALWAALLSTVVCLGFLSVNLYIPTDNNTGKLTGTRIHTPFLFTKEIDSSSPYLYKAVTPRFQL